MCNAQNSLDGFWRSEGYGYAFEVQKSTLKAFEVTAQTCVASFTAYQQPDAIVGRKATFASKDEKFFFRAGGSDNLTFFHQEETVPDIRLHKVNRLPLVCEHLSPDTPLDNFDVFTRTWAENYISFERRQVD